MILSFDRLILFISLFLFGYMNAQELSVTGILIDENQNPIESAEVVLLQNNIIKKTTLSSREGAFKIDALPGIYTLRCYYVGAIIYQTDFELNKDINLETIRAFENANQLDEVEVTSRKKIIESKVDRTVFNVENSVRATGSDGLELLKSTPGVSVSGTTIGIVGKSTVSVMIDDRIINLSGEELNNYLRGLSSENIKSIEVITTPPSKYDAQGNSGLINIKLKKIHDDSWAVQIRNNYIQNSYPSISSGINFAYNKNKLSIQTDFAKREGYSKTIESMNTFYPTENWLGFTSRKDKSDIYRGIIGLDYRIGPKATLGFKYIGLFDNPNIKDRNEVIVTDSQTGEIKSTYFTNGYNKNSTENNTLNAYFTQKIDSLGKQITIDLDYLDYLDDQNRNFNTRNELQGNLIGSPYIANNTSVQNIKNYSFKIDLDLPTKWANFGLGGKLSWVKNSSDIAFFDLSSGSPILDINQTNLFDYTENTQSIYGNFSKSITEKWQVQAGLRYEDTQVLGITQSPDANQNQRNAFTYGKFFPSLYLLYLPNENNSFSVNYSKRIGRPIFWDLNPFKWYLNSFTLVEGNPYLQPSFTDNFEINYNYKDHFSIKIYYSNTTNGSFQIPFIITETEPANIRFFRDNFFDKYQLGATITYMMNSFSWWESTNTLNGFDNVTQFTKEVPTEEQNGFMYAFYTYNTFRLSKSKNWYAEINFQYHSARKDLFNEATAFSNTDLGIRYSLKEKGWSFLLLGSDVFRSNRAYFTSVINSVPQTRSAYLDDRMIRLGVTYKFGNKKMIANQRESGNEEVKERIK